MLASLLSAWGPVSGYQRPLRPPSPGYPLGGLAMALLVLVVLVLGIRALLRAAERQASVPDPAAAPADVARRGPLTRTRRKKPRPRRQRLRR